MRIKPVLLIAFASLVLLAGIAFGHAQDRSDPNDVSDRLDLKKATISHTARRLQVDVRTWQSWPTRALQSGKRTIWFSFDTKGDNRSDYGINILRSDQDGLVCIVTTEPNGGRVGEGRARRNGDNHVSCSFRRSDVDAGPNEVIRWKGSMYNLETVEHDDVPDSGMLRHRLQVWGTARGRITPRSARSTDRTRRSGPVSRSE